MSRNAATDDGLRRRAFLAVFFGGSRTLSPTPADLWVRWGVSTAVASC